MSDNKNVDKGTGLLNRKAFLHQVHNSKDRLPDRARRGCLLIFRFPILHTLAEMQGDAAVDDALRHLLAIVETRLRSRDTMGRISKNSLCLLLKQCKLTDAVIVADQYVALLKDLVIEVSGKPHLLDLRYRVVPLDSFGSRHSQGVSRLVVAPELPANSSLLKEIRVSTNHVDLSQSKVVSLKEIRQVQRVPDSSEIGHVTRLSVVENSTQRLGVSLRLKPGLLIKRSPLVCCFRLQQVGVSDKRVLLRESDVFSSVLNALALSTSNNRPQVESQIILPVEAQQIDAEFPAWVKNRCDLMRVAPSDICLSLSVESLSHDLRAVAPLLRVLNRRGIRLMLEAVDSTARLISMQNLARFDYLYISGRALNDSFKQIRVRQELESLIVVANSKHCEICSGGVDSQALTEHALAIGVEIGFGRACGKSITFPPVR